METFLMFFLGGFSKFGVYILLRALKMAKKNHLSQISKYIKITLSMAFFFAVWISKSTVLGGEVWTVRCDSGMWARDVPSNRDP